MTEPIIISRRIFIISIITTVVFAGMSFVAGTLYATITSSQQYSCSYQPAMASTSGSGIFAAILFLTLIGIGFCAGATWKEK